MMNIFFIRIRQGTGKIRQIVLLILLSSVFQGFAGNEDSLRFEVMLTKKIKSDASVNAIFKPGLDISPDRLILLSTSDQLYLVGWGGIVPLGNRVTGKINSFSFTPDSILMVVRNNELCNLGKMGDLNRIFTLPEENMGIARGKFVMYVYDSDKNLKKHSIYAIARGGKYLKLLDVPFPVSSVTESGKSLLFTNKNGLFRFTFQTKDLKAVAALPAGQEIKSVAADTVSDRIYFSTDDKIFLSKGQDVFLITDKMGGILRIFGKGLVVFDPSKDLVVRISGMSDKMIMSLKPAAEVAVAKKSNDTLTNERVIEMVNLKLSEELIISIINHATVNFDLSVNAMIDLANKHVSSAVIKTMKNAMKKRTN